MTDRKSFGIRLEDRPTLPAALEQLAVEQQIPFCETGGFGALEWLEIAVDEKALSVRRFEGPLQLIHLGGRVRVAGGVVLTDLVCTVARNTDNGIEVLGGKLHRALASYLELTLTPLTPLDDDWIEPPAASPVAAPTAPSRREPAPRPNPPVKYSAPVPAKIEPQRSIAAQSRDVDRGPAVLDDRWAAAVMESKRQQAGPDFFDDEETDARPNRGDIVDHAQFGECTVTRIDDDHITLRKPDGRNIQLGLTVLHFTTLGERNGKQLFRVKIEKR